MFMKTCKLCKDLAGKPLEMVSLYVKRSRTKLNRGGYDIVGCICPACKKIELKFAVCDER